MTATEYCKKIDKILAAMFHLLDKVKPMNRPILEEYLCDIWQVVVWFTQSIDRNSGTDFLRSKFESWVTSEEGRLRKNLEDLRYHVDTLDTVKLITGPGRIEMVSCVPGCSFDLLLTMRTLFHGSTSSLSSI